MSEKLKHTFLPSLSLFTSVGTLTCCALPALLVSLGMGAVMAGLASSFPQLIWLSKHKLWVFGIAGILIILTGILRYLNRNAPCPIDATQAKSCMKLRRISSFIYWLSVIIFIIGGFFAFIAPRL